MMKWLLGVAGFLIHHLKNQELIIKLVSYNAKGKLDINRNARNKSQIPTGKGQPDTKDLTGFEFPLHHHKINHSGWLEKAADC